MIRRYYPSRVNFERFKYSEYIWEKYYSLSKNKEFLRRFGLFKQNINYKTGKELKGRNERLEMSDEFTIFDGYRFIRFENILKYHERCKNRIYKKSDSSTITVENYNKEVYEVNTEINKLKHWDDYVVFDGKKYGIPRIFKNVHRKDDCFGIVTSSTSIDKICNKCFNDVSMCLLSINVHLINNGIPEEIFNKWIVPINTLKDGNFSINILCFIYECCILLKYSVYYLYASILSWIN